MRVLNWFRKKEKRFRYIYPVVTQSDDKGRYLAGNLSAIRRAMQLYSNALSSTPLRAFDKKTGKKTDSYLLEVLKHPHRVLSWHEFCQRLTESYWIYGNFYAHIFEDSGGKVTALGPYIPGSCWRYASASKGKKISGSSADPVLLNEPASSYFMTQFGTGKSAVYNKFAETQIWHLKSQYQSSDLLNGLDIFSAYRETILMAQDSLETAQKFTGSAMAGPLLIKGVQEESAEQKEEIQEALQGFFKSKNMFLTLPPETDVSKVLADQPANFLQLLMSISTVNLSRIFSVPVELLGNETGASAYGGANLKECIRYFKNNSAKTWLDYVSAKLSELDPSVDFKFLHRSTQASDLREMSQTVATLVQSGVISKEKAEEWLEI